MNKFFIYEILKLTWSMPYTISMLSSPEACISWGRDGSSNSGTISTNILSPPATSLDSCEIRSRNFHWFLESEVRHNLRLSFGLRRIVVRIELSQRFSSVLLPRIYSVVIRRRTDSLTDWRSIRDMAT